MIATAFESGALRIALVSIDFDHDDMRATLASNGYWLDKGVFHLGGGHPVLNQDWIRAIFDFLATAAPRSRLAFTYIRRT
jgi:O-methyltransferase involved in polyketide biosynthesis